MYSIEMTVTPLFKPEELINNLADATFGSVETSCRGVADQTLGYMQDIIIQNSRRGTGYLADSINLVIEGFGEHQLFIGIGEIAKLPKYWAIINYGGFTKAAEEKWTIKGGFDGDTPPDPNLAGTGVGGGVFTSDGMWAMSPKTEIYGKRYIQQGENFMRMKLKASISEAIANALQYVK